MFRTAFGVCRLECYERARNGGWLQGADWNDPFRRPRTPDAVPSGPSRPAASRSLVRMRSWLLAVNAFHLAPGNTPYSSWMRGMAAFSGCVSTRPTPRAPLTLSMRGHILLIATGYCGPYRECAYGRSASPKLPPTWEGPAEKRLGDADLILPLNDAIATPRPSRDPENRPWLRSRPPATPSAFGAGEIPSGDSLQ